MIRKAIFTCLLLCSTLFGQTCFASSVRLIDDSPHKLRAVVRGSDGSNLGEMMVEQIKLPLGAIKLRAQASYKRETSIKTNLGALKLPLLCSGIVKMAATLPFVNRSIRVYRVCQKLQWLSPM